MSHQQELFQEDFEETSDEETSDEETFDQEQSYEDYLENANLLNEVPKKYWTDELILELVMKNCYNLIYLKHISEDLAKKAVKYQTMALKYMRPEEQTRDVCLIALKKDPRALYWITNQTEDLCLFAVTSMPDALRYVNKQTKKICKAAIKLNPSAVKHVKIKL